MDILKKWMFSESGYFEIFSNESVKHHKKCSKLQNKLVYTYLVRCDNDFFGIRHTLSLSKIIYGGMDQKYKIFKNFQNLSRLEIIRSIITASVRFIRLDSKA